jgi:ribosomal protein S18 acetylase RimI-like enzyme
MSLAWIEERPPVWDDDKQRIIGGAPAGVFALGPFEPGDPLAGDWWRVEDEGRVVGYGWMDTVWGDAEVLVAVDPADQGRGVGVYVFDQLEREAAVRGLRYLHNVVRTTHPDRDEVTAWLQAHGFKASSDGLLRRRVKVTSKA